MTSDFGNERIAKNATLLFQHSKPSRSLMVSVIVPVRNEAEHLVQMLDALRSQVDDRGLELEKGTYEVLLLANNCSDNSFRIAENYQRSFPSFSLHLAEINLPPDIANIGTARRLLMDEACLRLLSTGNKSSIIASTDGDSEVDPTWIFHIIQEIRKGNDAVGGRITTKNNNDQPCNYYLQNELYRNLIARAEYLADPLEHDPWPRHFQYFGASLAVTCEMYQRVGGLPQLPSLEDEAFHQALTGMDAKIRKSLKVKVTTSGRLEGRVEIGFSQQLREWSDMKKVNQPQLVPSAKELLLKFTCRRRLRLYWLSLRNGERTDAQELETIADTLYVNRRWLLQELKTSKYFGELWEKVENRMYSGEWIQKWEHIPITQAIEELTHYTQTLTGKDFSPQ